MTTENSNRSISVVIPSHNRAHTLSRCIESVLGQSLPVTEVILVDDGSTDETRSLMATRFPEVEYIYQENCGVSAARNRGIDAASGDWLAFLDSDDCWLPKKLELQVQALNRSPEYLFCHTDEIWIRNGKRVNAMKKHAKASGNAFAQCLPLCAISPSSVMLHRRILDDVGRFDEDLPACEDYDLWLRVCSRYEVLLVEELLLTKYGGHDDQLSRKFWGMDRFRVRAIDKILRSGDLGKADFELAKKTLVEKSKILLDGANKRGKLAEANQYEQLMRYWRDAG